MPALVIFGRRTILAGDDLRIGCCLLLLLRALQLTLAISVLSLLPSAVRHLDSVCSDTDTDTDTDSDINAPNEVVPLAIIILYVSLTIVLAILSVGFLTVIWRISAQGAPTETEARKQLTPLCQLRLISITTLRLINLALGFAALSLVNRFCSCKAGLVFTFKRRACGNDDQLQFCLFILVVSHLVEVVCSLAFFVKCFLLPHVPRPSSGTIVSSQTKWLWGCTCCCTIASLLTCCTLGGTEAIRGGDDHFADICATLADFFDCDFNDKDNPLDVAPTDFMVAFLLLLREQKQLQLELQETLLTPHVLQLSQQVLREHPYHDEDEDEDKEQDHDVEEAMHRPASDPAKRIRSNIPLLRHTGTRPFYELAEREILSQDNPFDVFTIAEGAHFMHISKAIYTWLMYVMYNPCTGPCQLGGSCFMDAFTCRNRRHHHQSQDQHHMEGETWCGWHERALLHESGLTHADILYAQFKVGVAQTPYCIAVDHEWKSIVIAIRGTLSLEDAVADLQVRPEPLDECGNECGFDGRAQYCHAGVFACAQWIYNDVEQCVVSCLFSVSFCFLALTLLLPQDSHLCV
uniref:Uncharacterized protein n=1 Tax=Attheya septentrionalis TaxID=420275 RepID=A0A7S2UEQ0_9STRA|mmetsp:Transcript_20177/g.36634  ORF Transcript_20177/g.36634 Transcript_20177/m.36634 type:complete len:576 (+) Transcript_20177:54-1781(+)